MNECQVKKMGFIIPTASLTAVLFFAIKVGFDVYKIKYYIFYSWLSTPFLLMLKINMMSMSMFWRRIFIISMLATFLDFTILMMRFFSVSDAQAGIALLFLPVRETVLFSLIAVISYILSQICRKRI